MTEKNPANIESSTKVLATAVNGFPLSPPVRCDALDASIPSVRAVAPEILPVVGGQTKLQVLNIMATATTSDMGTETMTTKTMKVNVPDARNRYNKEQSISVSSKLNQKLMGDVAIGCTVTFTVTPFLTVVDKAIVQRAAGTHSLMSSGLESIGSLLRNPIAFVRNPAFLLMWSVYAATYSTANSLKTIFEHRDYVERKRKEHASSSMSLNSFSATGSTSEKTGTSSNLSKLGTFLGTAVVNSGASLWKDRAYARMFGTSGAAPKVPWGTFGLWALRDCMVVGSSFILPDMMTQYIVENYPTVAKSDAQKVSQFSLPIATQFLAGPIQLLGLDLYNRPLSNLSNFEAVVDRSKFLARGFTSVVSARIARIAPGYGIGGVLNTQWRDAWREHLIEQELSELMSGTTKADGGSSATTVTRTSNSSTNEGNADEAAPKGASDEYAKAQARHLVQHVTERYPQYK